MTREQIIALAKQCGAIDSYPGSNDGIVEFDPDQLEAFFHAAQRLAIEELTFLIEAAEQEPHATPRLINAAMTANLILLAIRNRGTT